jgi:signal transduction histidine kinase
VSGLTIKQRLFWSNVLMIVIPVLLSLLLTASAVNLILDRIGFATTSHADSSLFYRAAKLAQKQENKWDETTDVQSILSAVQKWGIPSKSGAVTFAIYLGEERLYTVGNFPDTPLLGTAIGQPESRHLVTDSVAVFSMPVGQYRVYLQNTNYESEEIEPVDQSSRGMMVGIGLIVLVVLVILATNRFLTHFLSKSILRPLDILVNVVHKIKDGNLGYRINYSKHDEFQTVCADFNEMAHRIQELMKEKQRDDDNRRELIAGISHDLRTPLTSIIAYAEGLTSGVIADSSMQKEYLDTISAKAKDLEHIVGQLFQLAKLDVGDFPFTLRELHIAEELEGYVEGVKNEYLRRGLHISLSNPVEDAVVSVDAVQLRNVFTNLLENSLKYGAKEDGRVQITCRVTEGQAEIVFADNGLGVPEEKLDKLFHAFYRVDSSRGNPGQGSGLGLAISHRIIRGLGGTIRAENASDSGLDIIITLPVVTGGG